MEEKSNTRTVIVTGPESTGKTAIAKYLSEKFACDRVPEFARTYIELLSRPYAYEDIEYIANEQLRSFEEAKKSNKSLVVFDTGLIITKVWFDVVYNKHPEWLPAAIEANKPDLYLLCNTDLPWEPDAVRENGGKMRQVLFDLYKKELDAFGLNYKIVTGIDKERLNSATKFVTEML